MRIRVKDVLDMLAGGAKEQEILKDFPDLKTDYIRACIAYAARYAQSSIRSLLIPIMNRCRIMARSAWSRPRSERG